MSLRNIIEELEVLGHADLSQVVISMINGKDSDKDEKISKYIEVQSSDVSILKNKYCVIKYTKSRKEIFGRDLTDPNNDPAFYSKTKRGIDKAWNSVIGKFDNNTTMQDVINILMNENKIMCHSWCMMD